jgi:endoglucanase
MMAGIRINQVGYAPKLPKCVALLGKEEAVLQDASGAVVARFNGLRPLFDTASGDTVTTVDLGQLPPGEYTLKQGNERRTVRVSEEPYRNLLNHMVKAMYYQRCGYDLEEAHAGIYTHPACHTAPARLYTDPSITMDMRGGWHDAGDYGKYIAPGAVAVAHMLYAYRFFPEAFSDTLNIPESGNGMPDVLNECRYELDWMMRMQREDGALYHKLTKKRFADFLMPQDDLIEEYILPVAHCATGAFAACAALAARVYQPYDAAYAEKLLACAKLAWQWLEQNPQFVAFYNPDDVVTGEYGDENGQDELFWAASELFAATKEQAYLAVAKELMPRVDITELGWSEVAGLGAICCLFELGKSPDEAFTAALARRFVLGAERALDLVHRSGYGTALAPDHYVWGSILPIQNNGILLIAAWKLTKNPAYLTAALNQLDYLLGVNALDISFVTGFGEKPFMFPHHRPSASDGIDAPIPGLVSGGPNKVNPYASTREVMPRDTYPAKYYLDETPSADTNEIAIYWNSPAIFVAACFDALTRAEKK